MTTKSGAHSLPKIHVVRFTPGQDLKKSLQGFALDNGFTAATIVSCVGSLVQYHLRFANQKAGTRGTGHFEIVSLVGTLAQSMAHLHLAIANEEGKMTGGHLLEDNIIYTTAEVAIAELPDLEFERVLDPATGYPELKIKRRQ